MYYIPYSYIFTRVYQGLFVRPPPIESGTPQDPQNQVQNSFPARGKVLLCRSVLGMLCESIVFATLGGMASFFEHF